MKKLLALVLALALTMSLALPAMADDSVDHDDHTITITETAAGHEYHAYQIFKGIVHVIDEEKVLTDIQWGSGINYSEDYKVQWDEAEAPLNLLEALKNADINPYANNYVGLEYPEAPGALAEDATEEQKAAHALAQEQYEKDVKELPGKVAEALAGVSTAAHANAFANVVGKYLTAQYTESAPYYTKDEEGNDVLAGYEINPLSDGYYLVKESDDSEIGNETATDYILQLVEDTTVAAKDGEVTQDKDIIEGGRPVDACSNNIGDVVKFEIEGTLPENLAEFDTFYYAIVDTMSEGLTLDPDSIVVSTINGDTIRPIAPSNYTLYVKDAEENDTTGKFTNHPDNTTAEAATFAVEFENLKELTIGNEYTVRSTTKIRVEYEATVNSAAVIGVNGNPNESYVKFTRSPYVDEDYSDTPPAIVRVFTFQLEVIKYDKENKIYLEGVKFVVSRERTGHMQYAVLNDEGIVKGWTNWLTRKDVEDYVKEHAEYGKYEASKQAEKVEELIEEIGIATELVTDDEGKAYVKGLDLDLYWLTETYALPGYSSIEPVKFTISAEYDSVNNKAKNLQIIIDNVHEDGNVDNGMVSTTVINNPGKTLPTTGGMGTTLFYVIGGILAAAAVVLLVTKKRMTAEN